MKSVVLGIALLVSLSGCATMQNFAGQVGDGFSQISSSMFGGGHLIGAQISSEAYEGFVIGKSTAKEIQDSATVEPYESDSSKAVYRTIKQKSFKNTLITYKFDFDSGVLTDKSFEERKATDNDLLAVMAVKR